MSSKLIEVKLMLRDMAKCDTLGSNIHVFTAGNKAVEANLKELASIMLQVI